jgi:hypothetical protein
MDTLGSQNVDGNREELSAISRHIELHWGPIRSVFHEIASDYVHVDINFVAASSDKPFHSLITSGMSNKPMNVKEASEDCRFSELVLSLPESWPLDKASFRDERNWWPLRWLRTLARLPHENQDWLFCGHTVGNGDPPKPFAANTEFCALIIASPILCEEGGDLLTVQGGKKIHFNSVIPIYGDELELARNTDPEELLRLLYAAGVTELINLSRKSICAL